MEEEKSGGEPETDGFVLAERFEKYVLLANAAGLALSVQVASNIPITAGLVFILSGCSLLCFSVGTVAAGYAFSRKSEFWFHSESVRASMHRPGPPDTDSGKKAVEVYKSRSRCLGVAKWAFPFGVLLGVTAILTNIGLAIYFP